MVLQGAAQYKFGLRMTFTTLGRFRRHVRLSLAEALICIFAPILALVLRGIPIERDVAIQPVIVYAVAAVMGGLLALAYVQISKSTTAFVSAADLIKIFKVALASCIAGVIGTFFSTHMQYVPRFVPVIHFFLLFGSLTLLCLWRARAGQSVKWNRRLNTRWASPGDYQLLVGCTPLTVHYASLMDQLPNSDRKIAGIISICGDNAGSVIAGRTVLGPLSNISEILAEFKNHGVEINRIVISTLDRNDQKYSVDILSPLCAELHIELSLITDLLASEDENDRPIRKDVVQGSGADTAKMQHASISSYLVRRQQLEWIIALALAILASPIILVIGALTYIDVGRPVIFWQKRVGRFGHLITIHKFRTLPHRSIASTQDDRKPSLIGRFLQVTRLDEAPQIFDILERRLSFIGPRPLLPQDLPEETGERDLVLPGITGWAQVHGGKQMSPEEKVALDQWYINHASFKLDLMILFKTLLVVLRGHENRDERVIRLAIDEFRRRVLGANSADQRPVHDRESAIPTGLIDQDPLDNPRAA